MWPHHPLTEGKAIKEQHARQQTWGGTSLTNLGKDDGELAAFEVLVVQLPLRVLGVLILICFVVGACACKRAVCGCVGSSMRGWRWMGGVVYVVVGDG